MPDERKNLIVLFPGAGYTVDKPLLYYAGFKYYVKGYDSLKIDYGDCLKNEKPFPEKLEDIKKLVLNQVSEMDFSIYDDIVFVSKSMGTVIASWLGEIISRDNIRHVYLTPVGDTLQYIKHGKNISIVIAGTADNFLDTNILTEYCGREKIKLELIENADHALNIFGDIDININNLKRVVELM